MRGYAASRDKPIRHNARARKAKKKVGRPAKRPSNYRRPTLLLRKLLSAPGKMITEKSCVRCKEIKPLSEFYLWNKGARGKAYRSDCKICYKIYVKNMRIVYPDPRRQGGNPTYQEYQRDYYKKNVGKFLEYRRLFLIRNPGYFTNKSRERRIRLKEQQIQAEQALNDRDCS